jgi:hypothetical protein
VEYFASRLFDDAELSKGNLKLIFIEIASGLITINLTDHVYSVRPLSIIT